MLLKLGEHFKAATPSLVRGVCIVLVAAWASATIGASVVGRTISGLALDSLLRSEPPVNEDRVVLIDITEDDYANIFRRRRPLDPATILEMVRGAISGGASLVAVDIDTSDWPPSVSLDLQPDAAVVWAADFYYQRRGLRREQVMSSALGKPLRGPDSTTECYGVPALGEEAGVVRWFYSGMAAGSLMMPSFVDQVVYRSQHRSCLKEGTGDELNIIDFSARVPAETASTLLKESRALNWKVARAYERKIVIIGGSFHNGDDLKETPVGPMSGLEINGEAISSALHGKTHIEVGEFQAVGADILIGIILVLIGLVGRRAQITATVATAIISCYFSLYLFRQYYLFLSFIPICMGIIVHLYLDSHFHGHGAAVARVQ